MILIWKRKGWILMKKTLLPILLLVLALVLSGCGTSSQEELWKNALYNADTELGSGENLWQIQVKAGEKTIAITLHSQETILGTALLEAGLIAGEQGPYGLYVKQVNGITADYDQDGSYWGLYLNGEAASTGVDGAAYEEGTVYRLERIK